MRKNNILVRRMRRKQKMKVQMRGTGDRPRLSVFRSNTSMYAQIIDDAAGKTLAAASSREIKEKKKKTDAAKAVGLLLAKKAKDAGVSKVVFNRSLYRYHGRVKALAEGAREGGLSF